MKFLGLEIKFNGYDIWHKGNLTKLSQLSNDSGFITSAGSGAKIAVASTAPTTPGPGDFWYHEI